MSLTINKEFYEYRKKGLGGSDIGAILGVNKYKTALDVYKEKLGISEYFTDNKFTRVGKYLEPAIIKMYEDQKNCEVSQMKPYVDKNYPFLFGHVDGKVKDKNIIIEIKTAGYNSQWGDPGTNVIPKSYLCQVAHYAYLSNCDKVDIAVFFLNSRDFEIYTYKRNKKLELYIKKYAVDFWKNHIEKKIPPDPMNSQDLEFGKIIEDSVQANQEIENKVIEYKNIKDELKDLKSRENELREDILLYMNNHKHLIDSHNNVLAIYSERKGSPYFDINSFKSDHSDLVGNYLKRRNPTRALNIR